MSMKNKQLMVESNIQSRTVYVVLRNGARVSESEYTSKEDAMSEYDHWMRVIKRWPDGSKLEIAEIKEKIN